MRIAPYVSYAGDEITRLEYGDYPCEISLAVNVLRLAANIQQHLYLIQSKLNTQKTTTAFCDYKKFSTSVGVQGNMMTIRATLKYTSLVIKLEVQQSPLSPLTHLLPRFLSVFFFVFCIGADICSCVHSNISIWYIFMKREQNSILREIYKHKIVSSYERTHACCSTDVIRVFTDHDCIDAAMIPRRN